MYTTPLQITPDDQITNIHKASRLGKSNIIEKLLDQDISALNERDEQFGWTPLYRAVISSQYQAAKVLLERGAEANLSNKGGEVPLHAAIQNGNYRITKIKYIPAHRSQQRGLKTSSVSSQKWSLSQHHKLAGTSQPLQFFKLHVHLTLQGQSSLHLAVQSGRYEIIKILLSSGAHASLKDDSGKTPVQLSPSMDITELLEGNNNNMSHISFRSALTQGPVHYQTNQTQSSIDFLAGTHNPYKRRQSPMSTTSKDGLQSRVQTFDQFLSRQKQSKNNLSMHQQSKSIRRHGSFMNGLNSFISSGGVNTNLRTTPHQVYSSSKNYTSNSYITKSYTPTALRHAFTDRSRSIDMCSPYDNNNNNNNNINSSCSNNKYSNDYSPINNNFYNNYQKNSLSPYNSNFHQQQQQQKDTQHFRQFNSLHSANMTPQPNTRVPSIIFQKQSVRQSSVSSIPYSQKEQSSFHIDLGNNNLFARAQQENDNLSDNGQQKLILSSRSAISNNGQDSDRKFSTSPRQILMEKKIKEVTDVGDQIHQAMAMQTQKVVDFLSGKENSQGTHSRIGSGSQIQKCRMGLDALELNYEEQFQQQQQQYDTDRSQQNKQLLQTGVIQKLNESPINLVQSDQKCQFGGKTEEDAFQINVHAAAQQPTNGMNQTSNTLPPLSLQFSPSFECEKLQDLDDNEKFRKQPQTCPSMVQDDDDDDDDNTDGNLGQSKRHVSISRLGIEDMLEQQTNTKNQKYIHENDQTLQGYQNLLSNNLSSSKPSENPELILEHDIMTKQEKKVIYQSEQISSISNLTAKRSSLLGEELPVQRELVFNSFGPTSSQYQSLKNSQISSHYNIHSQPQSQFQTQIINPYPADSSLIPETQTVVNQSAEFNVPSNLSESQQKSSPSTNLRYNQTSPEPKQILQMQTYIDSYNSNQKQQSVDSRNIGNDNILIEQATDSVRKIEPHHFIGQKINFQQNKCQNSLEELKEEETPALGDVNLRQKSQFSQLSEEILMRQRDGDEDDRQSIEQSIQQQQNCCNQIQAQDQSTIPDRLSSSVGSPIKRASYLSHPMAQTFDPQKQHIAMSFQHTDSPTPLVLQPKQQQQQQHFQHHPSDKQQSRLSASQKTAKTQKSPQQNPHAFQGIINSNDPTINLSKQTGKFSSAKNIKLQKQQTSSNSSIKPNLMQLQQVPSQNYSTKDIIRCSDTVNIASKIPTPNPPLLQGRESSSTTTRSLQHQSIKLMPKNNTDDDQDKLSIQEFNQSRDNFNAINELNNNNNIQQGTGSSQKNFSMDELKQVIAQTQLNKQKSVRQSNLSRKSKIVSSLNPPEQISLSLGNKSSRQIDDQIIVNYDCYNHHHSSIQHQDSKKRVVAGANYPKQSLNSQQQQYQQEFVRPAPAQSPIIPQSELSGPQGALFAINPNHPNIYHKRRISSSIIGGGQKLQLFDQLNITQDSKYDSVPKQNSNKLLEQQSNNSQKEIQFNKLTNLNKYSLRTQNTQDLFISQLVPADQGEITPQPAETPSSPSKQPPATSQYPHQLQQHHDHSIVNTYTLSGSNLQIDQMTMTQTPLFQPINYNYSAIQSQVRYQYFENSNPYQFNMRIKQHLMMEKNLVEQDALNTMYSQTHEAIFRSQVNDVAVCRKVDQEQQYFEDEEEQLLIDNQFQGFDDNSPFYDHNMGIDDQQSLLTFDEYKQFEEQKIQQQQNGQQQYQEEEKQYGNLVFPRQMNNNNNHNISPNQAKLITQHPFYDRQDNSNVMMMMDQNNINQKNSFLNTDINEEDKYSPAHGDDDDEDDYNMMIQQNQEIIQGYPLQQQEQQQHHQYGLRPYYPNNQENSQQQFMDVSNTMIGGTGVGEVTQVAQEYEDQSDLAEDDMRKEEDATADDLNQAVGLNGIEDQEYQDQEDEQQNYAPSCQEGIAFNEEEDAESQQIINQQELKKQEEKFLNQHNNNLISSKKNTSNSSQVFDPNNESSYIFNDSQIIAGGVGTSQNFATNSAIDILNGKNSIPPTPPHYMQHNHHSQQYSQYESGRSSAAFVQGQGNPREYSSNIKRSSIRGSRIEDSQYFSNQYMNQSNRMSYQQDKPVYSKKVQKEHRFILDQDENGENYSLEGLEQWLQSINLQFLAPVLSEGGFDDIQALIAQMKSSMPVTDEMLKKISIEKPGHRARILVKLQEEAGMAPDASKLSARRNSAFGSGQVPSSSSSSGIFKAFEFCTKPQKNPVVMFQMSTLKQWLHMLRLQSFHHQFVVAGYENFEFMLQQMNSNNPITDSILKNEIGIQKLGYRTRILYKLHEDAYLYKMSKMQAGKKIKDKKQRASRLSNAKSVDIITEDIPKGQEEACKCQIF